MVNDPLLGIATRQRPSAANYGTPQSKPSRNTPTRQVKNSAGGYVFTVDPIGRLYRFLTLGVDGPTYYTSATDLAQENAKIVYAFADGSVTDSDGAPIVNSHRILVDAIVEISTQGRAPRQNPALFALAIAASNGADHERRYALQSLPQVARTATHLFLFLNYVQNFRGWGPQLTKYVGNWFVVKDPDALAYQMVKYRQREGWTHRDVLRKAHPKSDNPHTRALFDWACGRKPELDALPRIVQGYIKASGVDTTVADQRSLVAEYGLPWETLTDAALGDAATWRALIDSNSLPLTAMIRQLPRLTSLGLLTPGGKDNRLAEVTKRLTDAEYLHKSRIHPINVLVALRTYASGMSARGSSSWSPIQQVIDALDQAFYASFKNVRPTGKRIRFANDVSGSMTAAVSGLPLQCREATAALSLISASVETDYDIVKFTSAGGRSRYVTGWGSRDSGLEPMGISPRMRLDQAIKVAQDSNWGGTDCSLPMTDATEKGLKFDAFVVLTDNDTYAGRIHPFEALKQYRAKSGIHDAKLIVVSMTASNFSIADPSDPGMLDISGMDSTVPNVISDFIRG